MTTGMVNPRTWKLLELLADGEFHSGQVLANRLGVSRASVFNALSDVAACGILLQRIRGRGYRLARPWQRLEPDEILRRLGKDAGQFDIEILPQAASSNTSLLQRAGGAAFPRLAGSAITSDLASVVNSPSRMSPISNVSEADFAIRAQSGSVLAVELQTAGRGRMGRAWHSSLGTALTFSLLWRFDCGLNDLSGLSLAVGVAIVRALNKLGAQDVKLKWPNDIMAGQGKLAGVLIEAQGDMLGPSAVVIGIGLNCSLPASLVPRIGQAASALDEVCAAMPTRNQLLAELLMELARVLQQFAKSGFAGLRVEWERYHFHQNRQVRLQFGDGQTVNGVVRGVGDNGELCMETALGMRRFNSGEVEVERQ
jgi:BirA family transcriptional regulator, biotin operon repressor / biotin---[acetyl-CoA-carboxylase] ligase